MHYVKAILIVLAIAVAFGLLFGWSVLWWRISNGQLWGIVPTLFPFVALSVFGLAQVLK